MRTLTEFLLARIAEDEDAAQDCGANEWAATFPAGAPTVETAPGTPFHRVIVQEVRPRAAHAEGVVRGYQAHIARHDPVRILAECEAKRRIVALHGGAGIDCDYFGDDCITLRALALPYADHPDFQDEWRA